jgi:endonuclease/exonuclease/phosphatase family metal-dependent hydrolase
MKDVLTGSFVGPRWYLWPPDAIRIVDWNIERGLKLAGILEFLAAQNADLLTLQEVDLNARRTGLRNVAEELARSLKMNYAFGWEFQELAEGSRDSPAWTGQATLSRWPICRSRVMRFQAQSNFWLPKWYKPNIALFQERLGGRIALVTEIDMPGRPLAVFNVHLESRGEDGLRIAQLTETLSAGARYPATAAVVLAGDMNLDVSRPVPATLIHEAGFREAMSLPGAITSARKGLFNPGRNIDAILIRVGLESRGGRIHNRVHASDHYPVACTAVLATATQTSQSE